MGSSETRMSKALSLEWLGQTLASLCWIISVFVYGIEGTGDWLQLGAASCWMLSNIATIVRTGFKGNGSTLVSSDAGSSCLVFELVIVRK